MQVDSFTTNLIVEIYRNIQLTQKILKTKPFSDLKLINQSGDVLDKMMNNALITPSYFKMADKLSSITDFIKEIILINKMLVNPPFQEDLNQILEQLCLNLSELKQKIDPSYV